MLNKIVAKSTGESLIDHSNKVAEEVVIAKNTLLNREGQNQKSKRSYLNEDNLKYAALFHDIGKCTASFQKKMKNIIEGVPYQKSNLDHEHAEISFAFLSAYTTLTPETLKMIYWHHSISANNFEVNISDILDKVTKTDIKTMIAYVESIDPTLLKEKPRMIGVTPCFFEKLSDGENDASFLVGLSLLIIGDRIASGMPYSYDYILNKPTKNTSYTLPEHYINDARTKTQMEIASIDDNMFAVNAPTGFGKTLVALLWGAKSERKTIVVCPRNVITTAVYENLNRELNELKSNITNSKVISNEVTDTHNSENQGMLKSDFTTMNIDSFLTGSFSFNNVDLLLNMLHSDVIFDEYHELIGDSPIFAIFIRIAKARKFYCKGKTMLLSATPIDLRDHVDMCDLYKHYPTLETNYPTINKEKFKVNFMNYEDLPKKLPKDSLIVLNSVVDSQKLAIGMNEPRLIHHAYLPEDKHIKFNQIMVDYDKRADRSIEKEGFIGTSVSRTAMDVSFKHMYEVILSPHATIQTIGRCNRFGEHKNGTATITFVKGATKSDSYSTRNFYDNKLKNLWYETLENALFHKGETTLDELYELYHFFNKEYQMEIDGYYSGISTNSSKKVDKAFPKKKYKGEKDEIKKIVTGTNVLRTSENSHDFFLCCKDLDTGKPIKSSINTEFRRDNNTPEYEWYGFGRELTFINAQKEFNKKSEKNPNYDFSSYEKRKLPAKYKERIYSSKDSSKPVFSIKHMYSKNWGLIDLGKIAIEELKQKKI